MIKKEYYEEPEMEIGLFENICCLVGGSGDGDEWDWNGSSDNDGNMQYL